MDVEAVCHEGEMKFLEIDARLPSQTPTAVYWSTGWNMVAMMAELSLTGMLSRPAGTAARRGVVYEHVQVADGVIRTAGEHTMSGSGPLHLREGFYGADDALTNYVPGASAWVATLVVVADDLQAAWDRRDSVIAEIQRACGIDLCVDPEPDVASHVADGRRGCGPS
jgi:pyrrolysine biosynthesis protein PylC